MKIKIGTINELEGMGYEILVDVATRSMILARFYNGKMITETPSVSSSQGSETTKVLV